MITSPLLSQFLWLTHGFGLKNISFEAMLPQSQDWCCFQTRQVHGVDVFVLESRERRSAFPTDDVIEADAFVSNQKNMVCAIRTADCVPILLVDPVAKAVAAVHAGWKGTAQNIVAATIQKMSQEFFSKPADLVAAIGPAIGSCCYEVGEEVVAAMRKLPVSIFSPSPNPLPQVERVCINLQNINRDLLLHAGLKSENIDLINVCTTCDSRLASFRRDKSSERQWSFVALK